MPIRRSAPEGKRRAKRKPAPKPKVFTYRPPAPAFEPQEKKAKAKTRRAKKKIPAKPKTAPGLPPRGDITSPKQIPKGQRKDFKRMERGDGRTVYVRRKRAKRIEKKQQELAAQRYLESRRTGGRNVGSASPGPEDRDFKIGPVNVEAELEGRGKVAEVAEAVKKIASRGARAQSKARAKTPGASGGFSKVGPLATVSTGTGPAPKASARVARDVVDLASQIPASLYMTGAAGVEASQGRPGRAKELVEDFKENSAVALAAQGRLKEAGKVAQRHPVITALELSGTRAAVGLGAGVAVRGAGRAGRHGPKPVKRAAKRARRVGSTKRAPARVPGTKIRQERSYSPDLIEKGIQVAAERYRYRGSKKARAGSKAAARAGNAARARELRDKSRRLDPRLLSDAEVGRRVDERVSLAEVRRREHRGRATGEARDALPRRRADVALLIAQGIVRPTKDSLRSYMKEIDGQIRSGDLPKSQRMAAKKLRKQLAEAVADPKLDFDKLVTAARKYAAVVNPRQAGLMERGVLGREAELAKLVPYAVREMGAKFERGKSNAESRFVDRRGNTIDADAIRAHMRANDIDPADVAYVTQAPGQRGARNYFVNWQEPKGIPSTRRTGEATRRGTFDAARGAGVDNVARMQGLIDAFDEYAGFVDEAGYRPKGETVKSFTSRKEADDFARNVDSQFEWRAVPTRPQFGRRDQSAALLDRANADDATQTGNVREGVMDALAGKGEAGQWVLVPAQAADRLAAHTRRLSGSGTKITRKAGKQFSAVVLTTNGFTWPAGNLIEASVRSAVLRAGPGSYALGRRTVKELRKLDPELALELEARLGAGHFGAYQLNAIRTTAEVFNGTKMAPVARALGAFWRAPGPKQLAGTWDAYTRFIFGTNGLIEHQFKTAMFGKHLTKSGKVKLDWGNGSKVLGKAAEQAARGMKDTNEQVAAARFVRRAYGQYEAWSPSARFIISVFTPFAAWALNAVRFLTDVLPRDHPVMTGLLAASASATEEWRNEMGLGMFAEGQAPDWMQPSVPIDGELVNIGRYTPFGFAGDPLGTTGSLVLPQIASTLMATKGLDWKGDPITGDRADDATGADKVGAISKALFGSFVPFFALRERIAEKGVKKALNPIRGYAHDPKLTAAFDRKESIDAKTEALRGQQHPQGGGRIDADNPTPEYDRLLDQRRKVEAVIHRLSKGKYGTARSRASNDPLGLGGSDADGDPLGLSETQTDADPLGLLE